MATTILKPGGYNRLVQMAKKVEGMEFKPFAGTDTDAIAKMALDCRTDYHHVKPIKPLPTRKNEDMKPIAGTSTST